MTPFGLSHCIFLTRSRPRARATARISATGTGHCSPTVEVFTLFWGSDRHNADASLAQQINGLFDFIRLCRTRKV